MSNQIPHDLYDFMRQVSNEMSAEYHRIRRRASEDPGTAGDEGEENWAELLRGWIPPSYEVVTKGRIISEDGRTSPQVDVVVLKDVYPPKLLSKKIYLAAGVAAAFECKTTLKASHIEEATKTCAMIKDLYPIRLGTPYRELHAPILFGLLAHSHSWKGENSTPEMNISQKLLVSDAIHVSHPRQSLDVLCVADLGTWTSAKTTFLGPRQVDFVKNPKIAEMYGKNGSAVSYQVKHTLAHENQDEHFTPIGAFVSHLIRRIAWENSGLRDLADYYRLAKLDGTGEGGGRHWESSIYGEEIRSRVEAGILSNGKAWDEWSVGFF